MSKVFLIDLTKCYGCQSCVIQCKDEYVDNDWLPYSKAQPDRGQFWMKVNYVERGEYPKVKMSWIPVPCMHCDNPPCVAAAVNGAVYKRPDGTVVIDPAKAVGQSELVASCPYGAIYWNEDLKTPQKCTLCAHLLDKGWREPRCMKACPTDAIAVGEYEDLKKTIEEKHAVPMHPEYGAKPRVYYVGLPKTFITGAVVDSKTGDCLKGADVTAKDTTTGATVTAQSDAFGDFWLDGLEARKTYEVAISAAGKTKTLSVSLDTDIDLGDIRL